MTMRFDDDDKEIRRRPIKPKGWFSRDGGVTWLPGNINELIKNEKLEKGEKEE